MFCLCQRNAVALLWRVAYRYWPMIHCRWMFCHESCVCGYLPPHVEWMVNNWSSLEVVYGLLYQLLCKQTFNMLIQIKVIWSTEPIWNICIIWYFSLVINSNNRRSNETLVSIEIPTSDLWDRRCVHCQLSYSDSLTFLIITPLIQNSPEGFAWPKFFCLLGRLWFFKKQDRYRPVSRLL
jgi:hypothetical protein